MSETHEAAERRSFAAEQARIGCAACIEHFNVLRVTHHYLDVGHHDSELKGLFKGSKRAFFLSPFNLDRPVCDFS